ncbi:MAG: GNAT family N-acetyltransferase [Dehalococcoidia bacterium]|nr:GNAT family N-acetyltransferase [Dehalococcoidia bacterium]
MELRSIKLAEFEDFSRCMALAFLFDHRPEGLETRARVFEAERSLGAFDGDEMVGTAGIYSFRMAVPGGEVATAGVTVVTVRATHRRQGILTAMMRRQLADVRAGGEPLAALWASEAPIYGRFGYGLAAETADLSIERVQAGLAWPVRTSGRLRVVDAGEAARRWPAIWEGVRASQPGMMPRTEAWWETKVFLDPPERRAGFTGNIYVQYEEGGEVEGYVRYRTKGEWRHGLPDGVLRVEELMALNGKAYGALWKYVFGVDLVGMVEAPMRRVDEPLIWMLADPRRLQRHLHDSLWLRIVDVERALAGRQYGAPGQLVLEVRDDLFPAWGGRFSLAAAEDGTACCERTAAKADLEMGVAELGALYLGGVPIAGLALAGRVKGEEAALRQADRMFSWDVQPWCPEIF